MPDQPLHEPLDSDSGFFAASKARPAHLRWHLIGLVALGGAVGTGVREALSLAWPSPPGAFPLTILVINVVGAFVLGFLLEALSRRGADTGRRRGMRLLLGTGVLGGFTTYSSLAAAVASLTGGHGAVAVTYALSSLVVGLVAAAAGIAAGARLSPAHDVEERAL